jgi:hypothetical protein
MPGQNHFHAEYLGALHHRIEVFDLKPEKNAVAVGFIVLVADGTVMVFHIEPVQLQNQFSLRDQLFIVGTAVRAAASEQQLIPPAAGFNVTDCDKRLGLHAPSIQRSSARVMSAANDSSLDLLLGVGNEFLQICVQFVQGLQVEVDHVA